MVVSFRDRAGAAERLEDGLRRVVGRQPRSFDADFRMLGRFVWRVDAGEVLQLASAGFLTSPWGRGSQQGSAACRQRSRRLPLLHEGTRHPSLIAKWRDEGDEHDQSRVDHQLRDLRHPPDVLHSVDRAEAEISAEAMAHVVTVEEVGVMPEGVELLLHEIGDCRFARP